MDKAAKIYSLVSNILDVEKKYEFGNILEWFQLLLQNKEVLSTTPHQKFCNPLTFPVSCYSKKFKNSTTILKFSKSDRKKS